MSIQEAIEHLNDVLSDDDKWTDCAKCRAEHEQLREWLEELWQYRQIGTVDECKVAREKQIAKTPDYEGDAGLLNGEVILDTWICRNCGEHYEIDYDHYEYCPKCGQHIQHEGWESD